MLSALSGTVRPATLLSIAILLPGLASARMLDAKGLQLKDASFATTHLSFAIVQADFDHDGKVDLAVVDSIDGSVVVYRGKGDGTFEAAVEVDRELPSPRGLGIGDFNRDGRPDLVVGVAKHNSVRIYDGLGGCRFSAPRVHEVGGYPFLLTVADLNQDGASDVAVSAEAGGGVTVLLPNGRGEFPKQLLKAGKWSSDVAAADFNEDGKLDLAVTNWGSNDVSLLFGKGDGSFAEPTNITYEGHPWEHHALYRVLAADLDRDGHLDMVWNDIITQSLYVRYGDGQGRFPRARSLPADRGVRHAEVADLNGDGWLDLVSANTAANNISITLADGKGEYYPPQQVPVGVRPRMVALADYNGDQRIDIAVTNIESKTLNVFLNQGVIDLAPVEEGAFLKPALASEMTTLAQPGALVADSHGRLLVADEANHRIARIDPASGAIETIAGIGRAGFGGEGGPAVAAPLNHPAGVAVTGDGTIYVSDFRNHRIRKIDPAGIISTVAGTGKEGFSGDGGPALQADLAYPFGIALDRQGNLLIADSGNQRIRKIDPAGIIKTIAGMGQSGYSGDGGPAAAAQIRGASGLAVDGNGALLVADHANSAVRRIDSQGIISTIAGGSAAQGAEPAKAASVALVFPASIAVAPDGAIFIADAGDYSVRKLSPTGAMVAIVPRILAEAAAARAAEAKPWAPFGVVVGAGGVVYFTDRNNDCVRKVDETGQVTVVAGKPDQAETARHEVKIAAEPLPLRPLAPTDPVARLAWNYEFRSGSDDNGARAVAAGPDGTVYVAGDISTGANWRILQLSPEGKVGWHFDFDGGNVDVPLALTVTPDGQIVAAGSTFGPDANQRDLVVISLNREGKENWRYAAAGPDEQVGNGIVASAAGNLFVAGEAAGKLTIWSLTSTGQLRWQHTGAEGSAHAIRAVADGVVVAGREANAWYVAKLGDDGSVSWEHTVDSGSAANGIAAGVDGSVVVTGHRLAGRLTCRVEKLQPDGSLAWEYEVNSPAGPAKGQAVGVDALGNSFVVADFASDWLILALDPGGRRRWYFTHDGGGGVTNRDQVHAIVVKSPGEIVVSGRVHALPPDPPANGPVDWRVASYRVTAAAP